MKDIKYIRDYYNQYYTDNLKTFFEKTLILQAFKPYEDDYQQGKWLSKQMDIKGNEKILECGCGVGGVMKQLATLHPNTDIHGINVSDGQIDIAKKFLTNYNNCSVSVQDFMNTDYKDNTFDLVYFCESMGYGNFEDVINEAIRILKPNGKLYINEIVIKCNENELSKKELDKLNRFRTKWFYNVFDTDTIMNKVKQNGGLELIKKGKFIEPSLNWLDAVSNTELRKFHKSNKMIMPPIKGIDFLYKKIQL